HSSPALRCHTTVQQISDAANLPLLRDPLLGEGMGPRRILGLIDAQKKSGLLICAHGDGIPEALRLLEMRGVQFPGVRHSCAKASIWTLDLDVDLTGTAEYSPPPR
ncbi:MAG: hypothetical protein ACC652_10685, partial [Acidimicrobiales bacterium]